MKFTESADITAVVNYHKDNYKKLIDLTNFKFLRNPKVCNGYNNGPLLITIIHSAPWNLGKRKVIRNTWAKNVGDHTQVLFSFGTVDNITLANQIKAESQIFGDVLQGNFRDHYRNMTYKHVMGLKWVYHHCKGAKFILKTDDDVFINMYYLLSLLRKRLSEGVNNFMMCNLHKSSEVIRNEEYEHFVTKSEYQDTCIPTHCVGAVIVYSTETAFKLLERCQRLPYFWIDDVQVTGICAKNIRINWESLDKYWWNNNEVETLAREGPTSVPEFITGPFDLTARRMKSLWNAFHKSLTCMSMTSHEEPN